MPRVRFGLSIPPVLPPRLQLTIIRAAEWLGFDSIWVPDHVLFPDLLPCPEAWSILTAAIPLTRRVVMGTSVSDPHRMHPAVLAQRMATLDQLSKGRIILGLGSGESMNLDPFGIPWDRRVRRLKETVAILRGLWDSDEPFTFEGEFFQMRRARLTVRPYQRRHIPIYLASLGPLMQKFAGEVADGWVPISLPADHFKAMFEGIRQAALAAGRDPERIDRLGHVVLALTRDEARVLEMLQDHALGLLWPEMLERMGVPLKPPAEFGDVDYRNVNPCDPESLAKFQAHQAWIPREAIRKVVLVGDVRRIRAGIGELIDQGATTIHITNASLDPTATLTIAADIIPYFTRRAAPAWVSAGSAICSVARRFGLIPEADPKRSMEWLRRQQ